MLFIIKKTNAHKSIFKEVIQIDSPINTVKTPIIIGFLTYLYIPDVTKYCVGFHGANVPFPIFIKEMIVTVMTHKPININIIPVKKDDTLITNMFFSMYNGTKTKTVTGKIKEKISFIFFRSFFFI